MSAEAENLLILAQGAALGLLIQSSDPERLRQQLYVARGKLGDPCYRAMQFRLVNSPEGNLIILKFKGGPSVESIASSVTDQDVQELLGAGGSP